MMSSALMIGFIDEMEKVASKKAKTKEASFMRNVGDVIKQTGRRVGGTAMGMGTNAGRTMKAMVRSPLASTIEGVRWTARDLKGGSRFAKTLGVVGLGAQGLQTFSDIKGLRKEEDPTGRGRGRAERLGKAVGGLAGGLIGSPHGFTGAVVGSGVAEAGLGYAGRGVDKALAKLKSLRAPASAPPSVASNVHPPVTGARVVE